MSVKKIETKKQKNEEIYLKICKKILQDSSFSLDEPNETNFVFNKQTLSLTFEESRVARDLFYDHKKFSALFKEAIENVKMEFEDEEDDKIKKNDKNFPLFNNPNLKNIIDFNRENLEQETHTLVFVDHDNHVFVKLEGSFGDYSDDDYDADCSLKIQFECNTHDYIQKEVKGITEEINKNLENDLKKLTSNFPDKNEHQTTILNVLKKNTLIGHLLTEGELYKAISLKQTKKNNKLTRSKKI